MPGKGVARAAGRADVPDRLDRMSRATGHAVSWLTLFMVLVTFVVVVMRYLFDAGMIWLQESVIWMHGAVFMLGAAYTLLDEDHVRVDIFYRRMSEIRQAWINAAGVLLFLLPLCGYLAWASVDFALASWSLGETSREPGGLGYPWIPVQKSIIVLMPVAVGLQGLSLFARSVARILRG